VFPQLRRAAQLLGRQRPFAARRDHLLDELGQDPDERRAIAAGDVLERGRRAGEGDLGRGRRERCQRRGRERLAAGEPCRGEHEVGPPRQEWLAGRQHRDREADEEGVRGTDEVLPRELRRDVPGGGEPPLVVRRRRPAPEHQSCRRGLALRGSGAQARGEAVTHGVSGGLGSSRSCKGEDRERRRSIGSGARSDRGIVVRRDPVRGCIYREGLTTKVFDFGMVRGWCLIFSALARGLTGYWCSKSKQLASLC
jgi:hypothetical protein